MSNYKSLFAGIVAMAMMSGYVCTPCMNSPAMADEKKTDVPPSLAFQMKDLDGKPVDLAKYKGKVVLFVNVASKCGYTKQYEGLQKLFEKYESKGLVVVGVPCNQFGGQEAGSNKEIREFCTSKYQVTFDMLDKVEVNGDNACDLYKYLTTQQTAPLPAGKVKWNFEKFVVNRDGKVVGRFSSAVTPENDELVALIEKSLAK